MNTIDICIIVTILILSLSLFFYMQNRSKITKYDYDEKAFQKTKTGLYEKLSERAKKYVSLEKDSLVSIQKNIEFGKLSESIFHDLMNPLSVLSLQIENLSLSDFDKDRIKNKINDLENTNYRINEFIKNVRNIIGNNETLLRKSNSSLFETISLVRKLFEYKLKKSGVILNTKIENNFYVPINKMRLNQLFINLISNSIDSLDEKVNEQNKSIKISANTHNDISTMQIEDNGVGIDEIQIKNIFNKSFTTKNHGSGIGLMTIHHIVKDEIGGEILFQSKKNVGTKIKITFSPLKIPTAHP